SDGHLEVPIPYSNLVFGALNAQLAITREELILQSLAFRLMDQAPVTATGSVTVEQARLDFELDANLDVVGQIIPRDLEDMVIAGLARGNGNARLTPREPLPPGNGVIERWIAAAREPGRLDITVFEDAPLRLEIDANLYPQG